MKNISIILKNTREDLDLTQIEVMNITGINNKTLSGYENGVSEPDLETLAKLLNLYNLSADDLLEISKSKEKHPSPNTTSAEQSLLNSFRKLSILQQNDILTMISALADKK